MLSVPDFHLENSIEIEGLQSNIGLKKQETVANGWFATASSNYAFLRYLFLARWSSSFNKTL